MAGRHEVPVDPAAGPVQRFAYGLRRLRAEADGITYRSLARRAGYSVTTLSQAAAGERLPTLPVALAYAEACGGDLDEWEARWKEAVREAAGDGSPEDDGSPSPYRGLARFETGDSGLFFGREQLTADLVALLRRRRFAALFGPSGSGKSSLLRAGLIPVLRNAREPGFRPAAIRILTPGERPAHRHAPLLSPAKSSDDGAGDTIVVVDQFEEVFTLCHDQTERARFVELLLTARRPESRLRVLLAVRGDFYGRCAEHRDLADALRDANLLAGAMNEAELRDAVVKPARAAGLSVERALTARLVGEVADAPGGLPLLSHALLETWRRRRGRTLTMAGYEAAGCLDGAIARTAEEVHGRFTEDQAAAARRVLLRLVAPGDDTPDTRRPVQRAELPGTGGDAAGRDDTARVVEELARARLLTLNGDTVEMAHEALITAWPRLREWIEEDRERLRLHRKLTEASHTWHQLGCEQGALWRGSRLAAAREHFGGAARGELTDGERAFLDAGHEEERKGRRRSRLLLTAVTAALCLALVATGLAVGQWQSAVAAQYLAESRQLAARSNALLDSEPDLAALLAVHAYRTSPTREASAALFAAAALPLRNRLAGGTEPVHALALSPDGRTVAAHSGDGGVRIWDLPGGRLRLTLIVRDNGGGMEFSPDGRTLAVASATGSGVVIGLWDPVTGRKLRTLAVPDGAVRGMAFSPDGRAVAASSPSAVRVWDVTTGRERHRLTGHLDPRAVAFGPDGSTVVSVSPGGRVRVWDAVTGRTRSGHDSRTAGGAVTLSPDGRTYAETRADDVVHLRDVATGRVRRTLRAAPGGANEVVFAPDGRTLAVPGAGGTVRVWDTASGEVRATVTTGHRRRGRVEAVLSADGRTLVTGSAVETGVRVHRVGRDRPVTTLRGPAGTYVSDLAFSPDGHTVGAVQQGPPGRRTVQLWDTGTGDREAVLALDAGPAPRGQQSPPTASRDGAVGFGATGRALAARVVGHRLVEVREIATGRLHRSRALGGVDMVVFSPGGARLAVVDTAGRVRIWSLSTGTLRTVGRGRPVRTVAFTPDGRTLAVVDVGSGGDRVTLFDAATGRVERVVEPGARGSLTLAFSPDGRTLATLSGTDLKTWSVRTGRLRNSLRVEGGDAPPVFSPDGRTLAVSGAERVRLWDLATGLPRMTLPTRSHPVVAFSPDGRTLAIGTGGTVGLWQVDLPDPDGAVRAICEAVGRALTSKERSRHLPAGSVGTGCETVA